MKGFMLLKRPGPTNACLVLLLLAMFIPCSKAFDCLKRAELILINQGLHEIDTVKFIRSKAYPLSIKHARELSEELLKIKRPGDKAKAFRSIKRIPSLTIYQRINPAIGIKSIDVKNVLSTLISLHGDVSPLLEKALSAESSLSMVEKRTLFLAIMHQWWFETKNVELFLHKRFMRDLRPSSVLKRMAIYLDLIEDDMLLERVFSPAGFKDSFVRVFNPSKTTFLYKGLFNNVENLEGFAQGLASRRVFLKERMVQANFYKRTFIQREILKIDGLFDLINKIRRGESIDDGLQKLLKNHRMANFIHDQIPGALLGAEGLAVSVIQLYCLAYAYDFFVTTILFPEEESSGVARPQTLELKVFKNEEPSRILSPFEQLAFQFNDGMISFDEYEARLQEIKVEQNSSRQGP